VETVIRTGFPLYGENADNTETEWKRLLQIWVSPLMKES